MNLNKVVLIGRTGKDPKIVTFEGGGKIAVFSMATTEKYKNKEGEQVETTEWHTVVARGKLADILEKYLKKGMLVYVEGSIRTRTYESEGVTKYITEVVIGFDGKFLFMEGKSTSNEAKPAQAQQNAEQSANETDPTDDLPF